MTSKKQNHPASSRSSNTGPTNNQPAKPTLQNGRRTRNQDVIDNLVGENKSNSIQDQNVSTAKCDQPRHTNSNPPLPANDGQKSSMANNQPKPRIINANYSINQVSGSSNNPRPRDPKNLPPRAPRNRPVPSPQNPNGEIQTSRSSQFDTNLQTGQPDSQQPQIRKARQRRVKFSDELVILNNQPSEVVVSKVKENQINQPDSSNNPSPEVPIPQPVEVPVNQPQENPPTTSTTETNIYNTQINGMYNDYMYTNNYRHENEERVGSFENPRYDYSSFYNESRKFTKIFVGGLPFPSTDQSLHKYFSQFGQIKEAVVIRDRKTGESKGYGFVTMEDKASADKALEIKKPIIDGRECNINLAFDSCRNHGMHHRINPRTLVNYFPVYENVEPNWNPQFNSFSTYVDPAVQGGNPCVYSYSNDAGYFLPNRQPFPTYEQTPFSYPVPVNVRFGYPVPYPYTYGFGIPMNPGYSQFYWPYQPIFYANDARYYVSPPYESSVPIYGDSMNTVPEEVNNEPQPQARREEDNSNTNGDL